jgi:hypothetical protein
MMLNGNQGSHLRTTEIIVGWIETILKAIIVKLIADNICKYGKIQIYSTLQNNNST